TITPRCGWIMISGNEPKTKRATSRPRISVHRETLSNSALPEIQLPHAECTGSNLAGNGGGGARHGAVGAGHDASPRRRCECAPRSSLPDREPDHRSVAA